MVNVEGPCVAPLLTWVPQERSLSGVAKEKATEEDVFRNTI